MEHTPRIEEQENPESKIQIEMNSKTHEVLTKLGIKVEGNKIIYEDNYDEDGQGSGSYEVFNNHKVMNEMELQRVVLEAVDEKNVFLHLYASGATHIKSYLIKDGERYRGDDTVEDSSAYN